MHAGAFRLAMLLASLGLAAAQPLVGSPDPLWLKAVEASRRAEAWLPTEMSVAIELANDRGKVLDTWENRYRLSYDAAGAVHTEVLLVLHNGRDETAKEREAPAKSGTAGGGGQQAFADMDNPFDPDAQATAEVRPLGERRLIEGRQALAFSFTVAAKGGGTIEGTAWLDGESGLPLEMSYVPVPLPRGMRRLSTTIRYGGPAGESLPVEVAVDGASAMLLFRRAFRSTLSLGGWIRRD